MPHETLTFHLFFGKSKDFSWIKVLLVKVMACGYRMQHLIIACICVQLKNNCMSNSQVIARGEKYMRLPTNHIALPTTLYPYH